MNGEDMSVDTACFLLGLPDDAELRDRLTKIPAVSKAMLDLRYGWHPEQAAARWDLPWIDPDGVNWQRLLR